MDAMNGEVKWNEMKCKIIMIQILIECMSFNMCFHYINLHRILFVCHSITKITAEKQKNEEKEMAW